MKKVDCMPESGNFVAVWQHGGAVWSSTFHVDGHGCYVAYNESDDSYFDLAPDEKFFRENNAVFYVAEVAK